MIYNISLLGRDIGMQSPRIHSAVARAMGADIDFSVCDVPFDRLEATVNELLTEAHGFFVTKPYKTEIAKLLDAGESSINVVRCGDKSAVSTECDGFLRAIDMAFPEWKARVNGVLVLGAGGAAGVVLQALVSSGKKAYVLNRTAMRAARLCTATGAELYVNQPCEMIVNCTSVGENGEDILKALCVLPEFDYAYDLIYSTERTQFLRRCANAGAKTANGMDMLIYQAIEGYKFLLSSQANTEKIFDEVKKTFIEDGTFGG